MAGEQPVVAAADVELDHLDRLDREIELALHLHAPCATVSDNPPSIVTVVPVR